MTFLETRFREHPVWASVDQARSIMNTVGPPPTLDEQEALAHAGAVLELLEKRRTETDPRDVSPSMLQTLHGAVQAFVTHLSNVTSGASSWTQMIDGSDAVIAAVAQWPPMKIAHYLSGMAAATQSYQAKVAQALDDTAQAAARAAESTADGAARAAQTTADAVAVVEQRHAELAQQQTELATQITQERQRISEQIATFTAEGDAAVREFLEGQEARVAKSDAEWSELIRQQQARAGRHEGTMREYEEQSRKVLEAVGVNSTATDYGAYANTQGTTADRWRIFASLVFILAGAWFVYTSLQAVDSGAITWESSLAKLGVTAAVAGVGAYAARESSQHRRNERDARRVQLVLTALEPFIANMPKTQQEELRSESARAIFVLKPEKQTREEPTSGSPWFDVIRELVGKLPDTSK